MPIWVQKAGSPTTVKFSSPQEIVIDHVNDSIRIGDGTDLTTTTTVGADVGLDVNVINTDIEVVQPTHDDLNANANLQIGNADVATANPVPTQITDGIDSVAVNASSELQVRDDDANTTLTSINTKLVDGTDIGDVTINNAAGASAVNIQDGGNSITVDAVDLDIRDLSSASDSIEIFQATHDNVNLNANIQVGNTDVANGNPVPVSDAGGSITVDATDLDIRDLDGDQDNVQIDPVPAKRVYHFSERFDNGIGSSMDVDGSVTPDDFTIGPPSGQIWYITSLTFFFQDPGTMDEFEFGALGTALTNGLQLLQEIDSTEVQIANLQDNVDVQLCFTAHGMQGGTEGFSGGLFGWMNDDDWYAGMMLLNPPITLNGTNGDQIIARVRDNLLGLTELKLSAHGWREV